MWKSRFEPLHVLVHLLPVLVDQARELLTLLWIKSYLVLKFLLTLRMTLFYEIENKALIYKYIQSWLVRLAKVT